MGPRARTIQAVKIAGYHGDTETGTRLYIESGLPRAAYDKAFYAGQTARESGVECNCLDCKREKGIVCES